MKSYGNSKYAVFDMGSNSFHMLVFQMCNQQIEVIKRSKKKVALSAGLDVEMNLSPSSINRALDCLTEFASEITDIPRCFIKAVGTATLRQALNADDFLLAAERILNCPIEIISGEREAQLIYQGMLRTSNLTDTNKPTLVIDIGGASTEIIIGDQNGPLSLASLEMGSGTWSNLYFPDQVPTSSNYDIGIAMAKKVLQQLPPAFSQQAYWPYFLGLSGIIRSIQLIQHQRKKILPINLELLKSFQKESLNPNFYFELRFILSERSMYVFASGLSILIAVFEYFNAQELHFSSGGLREGLCYEMTSMTQ